MDDGLSGLGLNGMSGIGEHAPIPRESTSFDDNHLFAANGE